MGPFAVVLLLLLAVAFLAPWADRRGVPSPVVLAIFGIVVALVPGIPAVEIPPELALPLILPPLLFAASQRSSTREFTRNARQLVALAVGLVVVTTVAVAAAARLVDPQLPIAVTIVLGALVAPPDPVAATSVAGRLGLPRRVTEVLEGEGMLNDATALTIYAVAIGAVGSGFSAVTGVRVLLLSVVGAPVVGYVVGRVGAWLLARLHDARAEVTLTLLLPYASYLTIDELGGSGVLAVIVTGLYVGQRGLRGFTPSGFLAGTTVWSLADWVVSGLTFALIGFELTTLLEDPAIRSYGAGVAAAVVVTAVLVRVAFVLPVGLVLHRRLRSRPGAGSWRESFVVSWAGMRGVVTLATALSLPADMPGHSVVVLAAISVVLVTLVGQGLSLPLVVKALGTTGGGEDEEVDQTRRQAVGAALDELDRMVAQGEIGETAAQALRRSYRRIAPDLEGSLDDDSRDRLRTLVDRSGQLRATERNVILDLRARGEISAAAANRVLADLEAREQRGTRERRLAGD